MWVLLLALLGLARGKTILLDVPNRYMWGWQPGSTGYCGSCSTQMSGIYFGNWISQHKVRDQVGNEEIFIERNLSPAMNALKLKHDVFKSESDEQVLEFLPWVKNQLDDGYVVIAGLFWKGPLDEVHKPVGIYDHIIPIIGYNSTEEDNSYNANDTFRWYNLKDDDQIDSKVSDWVQTREDCSTGFGDSEEFCMPKIKNWGVAVQGNMLQDSADVKPTRIETPSWEEPDYSKEDGRNAFYTAGDDGTIAEPEEWSIRIHAWDLASNLTYALLRFSGPDTIPTKDFLSAQFDRSWKIKPGNTTFAVNDSIMSNTTMFYRCVEAPEDFTPTIPCVSHSNANATNGSVIANATATNARSGANSGSANDTSDVHSASANATSDVNSASANATSDINSASGDETNYAGNSTVDAHASNGQDSSDHVDVEEYEYEYYEDPEDDILTMTDSSTVNNSDSSNSDSNPTQAHHSTNSSAGGTDSSEDLDWDNPGDTSEANATETAANSGDGIDWDHPEGASSSNSQNTDGSLLEIGVSSDWSVSRWLVVIMPCVLFLLVWKMSRRKDAYYTPLLHEEEI